MRRILHRIFRYKLVSIYFILSQLVILTAIFGVLGTINKAYAKENDRLGAIAKNRIELNVDTYARADILSVAARGVDTGNVQVEGRNISVEVTEAAGKNRCDIILAANEPLPYQLIEGHIPDIKQDGGKNCVALGRDKYKYAYDRDGRKYITIEREEYEVVGVIGSPASDIWDYKIVLNIDCMSERLKKTFAALSNMTINIYSNNSDINESYNKVYSNIYNADSSCNITSYNKKSTGESTVSTTLQRENIATNIMVYVFCLINSIIISMFWTVQRKKELAIKRVCGMDNIRLIMDIAANMLILMAFSVVCYIAGYFIYSFIRYGRVADVSLYSVRSVMLALVLFVVTLVITMIYPVCRLYMGDRL